MKRKKLQGKTLSIVALLTFLGLGICTNAPTNATAAVAGGEIINTGLMTGMGGDATNNILINNGQITPGVYFASNRSSVGMYGSAESDFNFTNNGTMEVQQLPSTFIAYGMYASNTGSYTHTLTNASGASIKAHITDNVYGMYASSTQGNHMLTNALGALIDVSSTNQIAIGMQAGSGRASRGNCRINNAGTIRASGSLAFGMYGDGIGSHTLSNTGNIHVTGKSMSIGMYIGDVSGGSKISNTGAITTAAATGMASEAYGYASYDVDVWATTLRTWSANDAVFAAGNNSSVNFANTKLILRPGTAAQGFALGKEYRIYDPVNDNGMVSADDGTTVTGNIASVQAAVEVPHLIAVLTGSDPNTATVRLEENITPATTPGSTAAKIQTLASSMQFRGIANMLRKFWQHKATPPVAGRATAQGEIQATAPATEQGLAAGSSMPEDSAKKWEILLNPYGSNTYNHAYGFGGHTVGITAAATYAMSEKLRLGAHMDFNSSNYDANDQDFSAKSTAVALGLHGAYDITPEWYVSAQLTGSLLQNQYDFSLQSSTPASADANPNGEALFANINTGYVWQLASGDDYTHSLTPQVGISYLGLHTHGYGYSFGGVNAIYDMRYDDTYYAALYGTVELNWRSQWQLTEDRHVALTAGAGLRHNLTGNGMDSKLYTLGTSFTTTAHEDVSTWLTDLGMEYRHGNFSVALAYNGQYGVKQNTHGGDLKVKLEF